jgi:hypothetical protein
MSRQQLVKVFPDGKTLHVPSDGKPLPGYAVALAAHKLRGNSVPSSGSEPKGKRAVGDPIVIASVEGSDEDDLDSSGVTETVAVEPPLPRPSPFPIHDEMPTMVASAEPAQPSLGGNPASGLTIASLAAGEYVHQREPTPFEFESASHWTPPPVPAALASAMAERDISRPASLPIRPTAVVATVDVSRPLRAEAITTAVMSRNEGKIRDITPVFAYAAPMDVSAPKAPAQIQQASSGGFGDAPIPVANPILVAAAMDQPVATGSIARPQTPSQSPRFSAERLTLTALDTLGLRQWMADTSTRQRQYALLTMPDFSQIPSLSDKPEFAYRAGFGDLAEQALRTDRFSGPLVQSPGMVDLSTRARLAFR